MNAPAKVSATIHSAYAAAFAEIEAATKSANNPHFKSKYADLTSVIEAIKPALVKNGLFFTQSPMAAEHGVHIRTTLHHAGGESLDMGDLFVPANKNDAQAFGSALTYARRYALVTAFGVPVEDDDGNAASQRRGGQREERKVSLPAKLSDADWALLVQLVETTGTDAGKLCNAYKVDSLKDFTPAQFTDVRAILEKRLKEKADA